MKTILVAGSKNLEYTGDAARIIAEKLGAAIVAEPGWRLLTGGAKGGGCEPEKGGVDYHVVRGAQKYLKNSAIECERILTLHPRDDRTDLFEIGSILLSRAKSTLSRRFELVSRADCLVLIEGHEGSAQIVENAIAACKPVIPLACTGGASKKVWELERYRKELLQILSISEGSPELAMIENGLGTPDALIEICMKMMRRLLRPICFVVMPFNLSHSDVLWNEILMPVIHNAGMTPIRADLVHNVGQILEDITKCISEASTIIVDITGTNPNVMYELGYAHALSKPTILIYCTEDGKSWTKDLPFDIRGMRILTLNPWQKEKFLKELTIFLEQLTEQ